MGVRGGRGVRVRHGEGSCELPLFRGGRRSLRRRRLRRERAYNHWADISNCGFFDGSSYDEKGSSSEDATTKSNIVRRHRHLDDALFEFFSKQAIKSMKRNFSNFCRDSNIWTENKRQKVSGIDRHSFTTYSFKYFFEVLQQLTVEQRAVIENFGFGCLLALSKTYIPSSFIRWLAWCVDTASSQVIVDDKIINLSEDSFHFVLGLPNSGDELLDNSVAGKEFILSFFHLSDLPHITYFGNKLKSKETLSNQEVFVCFMQVAVCCFLCPSASEQLDTKFILQLGNPGRARQFNLCQLVYKHLMLGISKMTNFIKVKGRKPDVFEFCSYALAVYYLDCLDFGSHVAGAGIPRAVSWCGDMIKVYSELDRVGKRCYGRRRMRKDLPACYLGGVNLKYASHGEFLHEGHKESYHEKFGMALSVQTIDGIIGIVQNLASSRLDNSSNAARFVDDILPFLSDSHPWYKSSNVTKIDMDTPIGIANKPVDQNSLMTAPVLHPVDKFKSRLTLVLPDKCAPGIGQGDLVSPIGRMNLSPFSGGKEAIKAVGKSVPMNLCKNTPMGDIDAPILVGETTPKAVMESSKLVRNSAKMISGSHVSPIPVLDTTPKVIPVDISPKVTITGTSLFIDRQKQLAQNVDEAYNKSFHPSVSHGLSSRKKGAVSYEAHTVVVQNLDCEQVIDLSGHNTVKKSVVNSFITLQPKNSLVFPVAKNTRFPVSDEDIMHYCAIVELAYTEGIQKNYALKYYGVHCSFVSVGQTLMPEGHIDNFLIPGFCRKLFEDKHPTKSGRHYFFSYVGESILQLSSPLHEGLVRTSFLGAASASKMKRLDFSERLFFQICHLNHWFTFVVDFKWKLFAFMDSYYGRDSDYQLAVQGPLMTNFEILWKKIFETNEPNFKNFKVMFPRMPRQGNVHNCGVLTMKAMELFDPTKDMCKMFSDEDVGHIRIQYANSLFFHKGNKIDPNVVTSYYVKDDFMRQLHGG